MKILVVFTGGTIGSTLSGDYISPDEAKPYALLEAYRQKYGGGAQLDTVKPYTVLSENMDCSYYPRLLGAVREGLSAGYDGIIVTHGSDTVQYTAAMLSYTLGLDCAPVMLVCSNYVLEDPRANGLVNMAAAVDFIEGKYGGGVFVPYANAGEPCRIHRGSRLMPHSAFSDCLYSCENSYFGYFGDGHFYYNNGYSEKNCEKFYEIGDNCPGESGVLCINPYPGMKYPALPEEVRAVLLGSYHSGTLGTESDSLRAFAYEAAKRGVPLYLVGASGGADYESCREYEKLGIRVLAKISPVAAYIRLWLEITAKNPHGMETPVGGDYLGE
ncbi:MAG: asparaginase domain-containing protein [Butyrivibrio sp.]|nr:asparaginase domain-containing protein [Butyrivibrio sp.]